MLGLPPADAERGEAVACAKGGSWQFCSRSQTLPGHFPLGVALLGPALQILALVEELLAPADGDFELHLAVLEVHAHRHHREALLGDQAGIAGDFPGVHEKPAVAVGILGA